jgi:hypothetical protein
MEQPHVLLLPVIMLPYTEKAPAAAATSCEVFPHDPTFSLLGMPPLCPLPQCFENGIINTAEDALASDVAMIHRPTTYDPVELRNQLPRSHSLIVQPASKESLGHLTMAHPELWSEHVAEFMRSLGDESLQTPIEKRKCQAQFVVLSPGKVWRPCSARHQRNFDTLTRERRSRATDVRVSRQPDLVRADNRTPAPRPLTRPRATIPAGYFTTGSIASSHE